MSSKYDKTIAISREEEGTYHRRQVDPLPPCKPVTTYHTERYLVEDDCGETGAGRRSAAGGRSSKSQLLSASKPKTTTTTTTGHYTSDEDDKDNFEEWTTSRRKVNHKTRQVETRVSRQLLVENGKVIADSGPQVTTRIKEDNKVEECEKEKTPKNKGRFEALEAAPEVECVPGGGGRVLGEKKEIQRVSREVREENMQYHDERFKELTGRDVHQKAIRAPHELITIDTERQHAADSAPRGKMVHYSNRGKKYQDTDEILEVAKLAIDGSITKEVKRTHNHEEFSEDEKPDEKGEAEELRHKPVVQRSSRRHVDYVNDYNDTRTPEPSDNDEREEYDSRRPASGGGGGGPARASHRAALASGRRSGSGSGTGGARRRGHSQDSAQDEAFPRYEPDALLSSLRDDEHERERERAHRPARVKEVALQRKRADARASSPSSVSSSDLEQERRRSQRPGSGHRSPAAGSALSGTGGGGRVEIPEVYRVNKQRLLAGKSGGSGGARERSYSPVERRHQQQRRDGRNRQREDAATQARLTDEEIERQSVRSSLSGAGAGQQAKTARHLERQSTPNASRRYYFGNAASANAEAAAGKRAPVGPAAGKTGSRSGGAKTSSRRRVSSVSSSASSVSSLDEIARARHEGARSRDSGFRSPNQRDRADDDQSPDPKQRIYSVSSKSARAGRERASAASPTLTQGSAGQRSVKTTTTTLSAGLADRPESPRSKRAASRASADKGARGALARRNERADDQSDASELERAADDERRRAERQFDTLSVSSLSSPSATKIKVPYRHVIEIQQGLAGQPLASAAADQQRAGRRPQRQQQQQLGDSASAVVEKSSSEMSFQEDIESLSKRLASISEPAAGAPKQRFDYKTVVANVQAAPAHQQARHQVVDSYNVRLEQKSPFQQQANTVARPDPATGEPALASGNNLSNNSQNNNNNNDNDHDNNNEANFNLSDYYVKYRATPALVDESVLLALGEPKRSSSTNENDDDDHDDDNEDRMSQVSSSTYKIRTLGADCTGDQRLQQEAAAAEFDENGDSRRPAAWIFDPRDNSSTAIVPPARPQTPRVDAKTEELVQARGGRSYYLELVDGEAAAAGALGAAPAAGPQRSGKRARPSSMDSLYARWNSQGALNAPCAPRGRATGRLTGTESSQRPLAALQLKAAPPTAAASPAAPAPAQFRSPRQINSAIAWHELERAAGPARRQLPFSGAPLTQSDKSKSSSCLLSVTRPSKYSIYGGFRRPGETSKPVPRLSYSRAIGPRSQRIDAQPKPSPSRYLKMR